MSGGTSLVLYLIAGLIVVLSLFALVSERAARKILPWWVLVAVVGLVLLFTDGVWWRLP